MRSVIRSVLFPLLALGFGALVALFVLEAGLRLADWPSPGLYQGSEGPLPLAMPTAEGSSWRRYPGPARVRHWDYDVEVAINRHGFVEREPAAKDVGTWRVGVFGDSFVLGMGVVPERRFTEVWRNSIASREGERDLEAWNFGSVWCGSAQNAAFLAAHGESYALDEVVLAVFGGNELDDNLRWADYAARTPEEQARDDAAQSSGTSLRTWIRNHSRAAGFLFVTLAGRFTSRAAVVPDANALASAWPTTRAGLEAFVAAAGARPATLWYLPDTHEWDDALWETIRSELGLRAQDRHVVRDAIRDWAAERGLPFVDLTQTLAGRSASELRFRRDGHWNEAGHALVGEALARDAQASLRQRERP